MAQKDVKEDKNGTAENNSGFDINSDESLSGTTHLNEPLVEGSRKDKTRIAGSKRQIPAPGCRI